MSNLCFSSPEKVAQFIHAIHLHSVHRPSPEVVSDLLATNGFEVIINTDDVLLLQCTSAEFGEFDNHNFDFDFDWIADMMISWECAQVLFTSEGVDYTPWLES